MTNKRVINSNNENKIKIEKDTIGFKPATPHLTSLRDYQLS